jgi:hypothetical protein
MTEHHLWHIILACYVTRCHVSLRFPHHRLPKGFSHSGIILKKIKKYTGMKTKIRDLTGTNQLFKPTQPTSHVQ